MTRAAEPGVTVDLRSALREAAIVGAAIRLRDGRVFAGTTHHAAFELAFPVTGLPPGGDMKLVEPGFTTADRRFLTRAEATARAQAPGWAARWRAGFRPWPEGLHSSDLPAVRVRHVVEQHEQPGRGPSA